MRPCTQRRSCAQRERGNCGAGLADSFRAPLARVLVWGEKMEVRADERFEFGERRLVLGAMFAKARLDFAQRALREDELEEAGLRSFVIGAARLQRLARIGNQPLLEKLDVVMGGFDPLKLVAPHPER